MALQTIGVKLVAQNATQATKQVDAFNKSVQNTQKTAKSGGGLSGFFKNAISQSKDFVANIKSNINVQGLFQNVLSKVTGALGSFTGGLGSAISQLGAFTGGVGSAVVAVIALTTAMFKLGQRGAIVEQTQMAFSRVVGSIGNAEGILGDLRKQTRGTVADIDLMKLSIIGLQGTSDIFRSEVLPNMGKIIDVSNRVAVATGKSADVIREKFITGLRRQSTKLIDDIGVMVDATKANEAYAQSIGKSVSALSDQEKQVAFSRAAIAQLDRIGKEVGGETGGLVSMQQASAAVRNAMDTMGRAFKPVFELIATGIASLANLFMQAANIIAPIVRSLVDYISEFIRLIITFGKVLLAPLAPIVAFGRAIGKWIIAILIVALDTMKAFIRIIRETLEGAIKTIQSALGKIFGNTDKQVDSFILTAAEKLAYGGAFIIGAFAAGLLKGATFVIQAVTFIAGIVADFLEGFSPPKKGPLHEIDKGGENVARSWAEGFIGGIRQPVTEAASFVQTALGNIASFSRDQVATALAQLDLSIRPFVEQLEIAKATMEEVAGFVDPATKILERQRKNALQALLKGESTDTSTIIGLDQQLVMLDKIKKAEQERVDQAELQQKIAEADIIRQKTLLLIQQKRLGEAEKMGAEGKDAADKALKGGATPGLEGEDGFGGIGGAGEPFTLGSSSIADAVAKLKGALSKGASEGLAASGFEGALAGFNEQTGELKNNISRIKNSKPGKAISDALSGIPGTIQGALDTVSGFVSDQFNNIFGDDGIVKTQASNVGNAIKRGIESAQSIASDVSSFLDDKVLSPITDWFSNLDLPSIGEIADFPMNLIESLFPTDFVDLVSGQILIAILGLTQFFTQKFAEFIRSLGGIVWDAILFLVSSPFKLLELGQKALDLGKTVIDGIVDFFSGDSAINGFWNAIKKIIEDVTSGDFLQGILEAAFGLGGAIVAGIIDGILAAAGSVAEAVTSIIPDVPNPFGGQSNTTAPISAGSGGGVFGMNAGTYGLPSGGGQSGVRWTGSGAPNDPRGTYHAQESIIPRFGMMAANAPIRIIPTPQGPFLEGLQQFASMLGNQMTSQPQAMPIAGASTVNNYDNRSTSMNTTFNVRDRQSAIRLQREMIARQNI